jgi:uncharacterized OsmC-like protein
MAENDFTVEMEQIDNFEFRVRFDWDSTPDLILDEPEPLGGERGPNATRLIAAAVGNCLTASLFFCLQRSRKEVSGFTTSVRARVGRNEDKRLRIEGFDVRIELPADADPAYERCLQLFEDFCIVTASVRRGIPVAVEVVDRNGTTLMTSDGD